LNPLPGVRQLSRDGKAPSGPSPQGRRTNRENRLTRRLTAARSPRRGWGGRGARPALHVVDLRTAPRSGTAPGTSEPTLPAESSRAFVVRSSSVGRVARTRTGVFVCCVDGGGQFSLRTAPSASYWQSSASRPTADMAEAKSRRPTAPRRWHRLIRAPGKVRSRGALGPRGARTSGTIGR